jgi:hypothetical protein
MIIDTHIYCALVASKTINEFLDILPNNDLVEELRNVAAIQEECLFHFINGTHLGTSNVHDFLYYADELKHEAMRIKDAL